MQVRTASGSVAAGLGIIGSGLAWALPEVKWLGWLMVAAGFFVFLFDIRLERGQLAVGSPQPMRQRLRTMWPEYLMVISGCGFFVGLVAFLQLNAAPSAGAPSAKMVDTKGAPEVSAFTIESKAFVEAKVIRSSDGEPTELFELKYYLPVVNAIKTGRTLRHVQVAIEFDADARVFARNRDTSSDMTADIRNGQRVYFEVFTTIRKTNAHALLTGSVAYTDDQIAFYRSRIASGTPRFEIKDAAGRFAYGIGFVPADLKLTVSADEEIARTLSGTLFSTQDGSVSFQIHGP
ncbi:hypothetical protein [Bradyrhizobium cajani]|uniref:Uncharacterized protein n=1 Tax=Bradyrhizobium cajani TaxID=1928661 RepID=A0A844TLM9_9BRAD|nr:hypothetical protein [Bradyrhizobium cajani]MCP3370766.1 hypothetical protein [Bradyrhizobium cajani]MVT75871.1 hypothetical protein [Bradyrhizobium cajani]